MENPDLISQKDELKAAISQMDLGLLDKLLDEDNSFFEMRKSYFLLKLEEIFAKLHYNGDFELHPFPGYCDALGCNRGCGGYAFYAPNSHEKVIVRFFEYEDGSLGLDRCCEFYTGERFLSEAEEIHLFIGKDEHIDFEPTKRYKALAEQCLEALSESNENPKQIVDADTIQIWVEAYKDLYKETYNYGYNYKAFEDFQGLFVAFEPLYNFITNPESIIQALADYRFEGLDELERIEAEQSWREKYNVSWPDYLWFRINPNDPKRKFIPLSEVFEYILLDYKTFAPLHRFQHLYFELNEADYENDSSIDFF
jgi:hypothetical protein